VPFKAKAAYRRHIPKQRHRVTNWAEYDARPAPAITWLDAFGVTVDPARFAARGAGPLPCPACLMRAA